MLIPPKTPSPKADRILFLEVYRKSILISETAFSKFEDVLVTIPAPFGYRIHYQPPSATCFMYINIRTSHESIISLSVTIILFLTCLVSYFQQVMSPEAGRAVSNILALPNMDIKLSLR